MGRIGFVSQPVEPPESVAAALDLPTNLPCLELYKRACPAPSFRPTPSRWHYGRFQIGANGFARYDSCRYAHHGAVTRHVVADERVWAHDDIVADGEIPKHLGSGAEKHVVANRWPALATNVADADILGQRATVAHPL